MKLKINAKISKKLLLAIKSDLEEYLKILKEDYHVLLNKDLAFSLTNANPKADPIALAKAAATRQLLQNIEIDQSDIARLSVGQVQKKLMDYDKSLEKLSQEQAKKPELHSLSLHHGNNKLREHPVWSKPIEILFNDASLSFGIEGSF